MQGNGGTVSSRRRREAAVQTVMSGPASGVIAAAFTSTSCRLPERHHLRHGRHVDRRRADRERRPLVTAELELEYAMPIRVPMVDVHTVGAGGGSIARVDAAGMLQVGPQSAGAMPGPICFGRGGTRADDHRRQPRAGPAEPRTAHRRRAGQVSLEHVRERVLEAVGPAARPRRDRGGRCDLARGQRQDGRRAPHRVAGTRPRSARLRASSRSAARVRCMRPTLARELGIPKVLIPARPGMTNALGCVVADLRHDFVRTVNTPLDELPTRLDPRRARRASRRQGATQSPRRAADIVEIDVDLHRRHAVQGAEPRAERAAQGRPGCDRRSCATRSTQAYWQRFRVRAAGGPARCSSVCTPRVIGRRNRIDLSRCSAEPQAADVEAASVTARRRSGSRAAGRTRRSIGARRCSPGMRFDRAGDRRTARHDDGDRAAAARSKSTRSATWSST